MTIVSADGGAASAQARLSQTVDKSGENVTNEIAGMRKREDSTPLSSVPSDSVLAPAISFVTPGRPLVPTAVLEEVGAAAHRLTNPNAARAINAALKGLQERYTFPGYEDQFAVAWAALKRARAAAREAKAAGHE